jgi:hypothetical protein
MLAAYRYYLLLLVLVFMHSLCERSNVIAADKSEIPNIYNYTYADIKSFLSTHYPNENLVFQSIRRNSSGTKLYIHCSSGKNKNNIIIVVPLVGKNKEIISPAKVAYINDNEDIVVWSDNLSQIIHFKKNISKKMMKVGEYGSGSFCIDLSGKYFAIETQPGITEVFDIENPNQSIFQTEQRINRIFLKQDKIYLFDYDNQYYEKKRQHEKIICQIYGKNDSSYKLEDKFHIQRPSTRPSPFVIVDMDTESENVIVEDVRDNPLSFLTSLYLFDLKIKKISKIGRAKGNYIFFLKEDILRK